MKPLSKLNPAVTYTFNILNVMKLRDHLAWLNKKESKPKIGFNMATYYYMGDKSHDKSGHSCQTIACMAGHAATLANKGHVFHQDFTIFQQAQTWLGLTNSQAMLLFHGQFHENENPNNLYDIPLRKVITQLDYMIETGKI